MNYTVIHGNVLYKVENVTYQSDGDHRVFRKDGKLVLSVPLSSTLIKNEEGISMQILKGIHPVHEANTSDNASTAIINSNDNFAEGVLVGGVVGAILF